jgi:hypothetical protein
MIIQGNTVMYKANNQQLQTFRGIRNNYNSKGEDTDYINDLRVLNNQQLRDKYYKTYIARTQNKFLFSFSEVQKTLESFRKCDECKHAKVVKDICCEDNRKVIIFILFIYF